MGFQSSYKTKELMQGRAETQSFQTFSIWVRLFLYAYPDHSSLLIVLSPRQMIKSTRYVTLNYLFPLTLAISVLSTNITLSILSLKRLTSYSLY